MRNKTKHLFQWIVVLATLALFIMYVVNSASGSNFQLNLILEQKELIFKGIWLTIVLSLVSFVLSTIFGLILLLMNESKYGILKKYSTLVTEIAMGTPLLVLVVISVYFIGRSFNVENKLVIGVIAITFYSGPYIFNVLSGALRSIDKDQYVLMDFYYFNTFQRYVYIIIPQIIKQITPGMIGNLSMIIKSTSLLNVVAIGEIFYQMSVITSRNYAFTEGYLVLWVIYLIITIPLSILTKYLQRRYS